MDLDGTLLNAESRVPEENIRAIQEAVERGIEVVVVTGRRYHSARLIVDALPEKLHLIVNNGALMKTKDGATHQRMLLPSATARRVLQATPEFRSSAAVVFDRPKENQVIMERIDWDDPFRGGYFRRSKEFLAEVKPLEDCLDGHGASQQSAIENRDQAKSTPRQDHREHGERREDTEESKRPTAETQRTQRTGPPNPDNGDDPIQVMFVGLCATIRAVLEKLEGLEFRDEFTLAFTEYLTRDISVLDVLRKGASKGVALAEWARHQGIRREEVMAIGDNWNDREMLEFAGLPVVMGNSVEGLKSRGWAVTLSNDEAGLAHAIRRFAFGGASGE